MEYRVHEYRPKEAANKNPFLSFPQYISRQKGQVHRAILTKIVSLTMKKEFSL